MSPLVIIQSIVSVLLILVILLQQRGSGLAQEFGGTGVTYVQRRGAEQLLYRATMWLAVLLCLLSILQWYIW